MSDKTKLYPYILLPENYWDCRLSELPDDGSSKNTFKIPYKEIVKDWVINFKNKIGGRGLYLYGPYGRGKSGIGALLLKAGLHHGYAGMWLNFPMLQDYSIKEDRYMFDSGTSMLERAYETDLLFVDEITIDDNKHWPLGILESIIRNRYQNKQTTILASNSSPADIRKKALTRSLASILSEATNSLEIDGKNFRQK